MALETYRSDMETCSRCSACKFIPLEKVGSYRYAGICPSIARYHFHAYSGGGRMAIGVALLDKRLEETDELLKLVYDCQMCGGCDIACKYALDMEVLEPLYEIRARLVENGRTVPALDRLVRQMRQGEMLVSGTARRGEWLTGLKVKDATRQTCQVIYHAGCRTAAAPEMWGAARITVSLLQKAGIDVGTAGEQEICCGGRAYQMGYQADARRQAEKNMALIAKSGARTLVTGCAECYHAFKVMYQRFGLRGELEVLHATEYLARLLQEGRLRPQKKVNLKVTYQDPCYLGRLGEPYRTPGRPLPGLMRLFDPPKEFRRGTGGVYEPPRQVLRSIPGLELVEMERTKEYAWCCGAGGGVSETNPELAIATARERLDEAKATKADVIATACPGCRSSLKKAGQAGGPEVRDVVELLDQAI